MWRDRPPPLEGLLIRFSLLLYFYSFLPFIYRQPIIQKRQEDQSQSNGHSFNPEIPIDRYLGQAH